MNLPPIEPLVVFMVFAVWMPGMLILITYFLAHLGGWTDLAERFAEKHSPGGSWESSRSC